MGELGTSTARASRIGLPLSNALRAAKLELVAGRPDEDQLAGASTRHTCPRATFIGTTGGCNRRIDIPPVSPSGAAKTIKLVEGLE